MIPTPFNYAGCKLELLPQLHQYFPKEINTFVDVFAGSGATFVNTPAKQYIVNDKIAPLIYFMEVLYRNLNGDFKGDIVWLIEQIKESRMLTKQSPNFKQAYQEYRSFFNSILPTNFAKEVKGIAFYLLLCCCHNNLIRFNKSMEFNQTFGDRTFNDSSKKKLIAFQEGLANKQIKFYTEDFAALLNMVEFEDGDFVYCDPPYIITEAGYNTLWSLDKEKQLYAMLDSLNSNNIKWGLSNVSIHKTETNTILSEWMQQYNVIILDKNYLKVAKKKINDTVEVYVHN